MPDNAANTGNTSNTGKNSFLKDFTGIPMGLLISQPIIEVAKGQAELCNVYLDQLFRLAFDQKEKKKEGSDKKETIYEAKMIKFTINRTVMDESGKSKPVAMEVEAPLLSLVPVPAFTMEEASVSFSMEVKDSIIHKTTDTADSGFQATYGSWGMRFEMTGNVSTTRENTRQTDKSAKYDISARASQQPPAEGMAKLTSLFASIVEPIQIK